MNSLCQGVRDSFTVPRSRALGGKSGMTRAAPLVLFCPRLPDRPYLLLLLLCLSPWSAWVLSLPPAGPPSPFMPAQEQACHAAAPDRALDPVTQEERCAVRAAGSDSRAATRRA